MPGTPQQNGVDERRNRTLMEMVRSMMSYYSVLIPLWGEALKTAMYILNRTEFLVRQFQKLLSSYGLVGNLA